jgi:hypothetical protein
VSNYEHALVSNYDHAPVRTTVSIIWRLQMHLFKQITAANALQSAMLGLLSGLGTSGVLSRRLKMLKQHIHHHYSMVLLSTETGYEFNKSGNMF